MSRSGLYESLFNVCLVRASEWSPVSARAVMDTLANETTTIVIRTARIITCFVIPVLCRVVSRQDFVGDAHSYEIRSLGIASQPNAASTLGSIELSSLI